MLMTLWFIGWFLFAFSNFVFFNQDLFNATMSIVYLLFTFISFYIDMNAKNREKLDEILNLLKKEN